jgi:transglutaminase-like putative cysteine protease
MPQSLIYGLLLSLLLVIAPHAEHLPIWLTLLCALLLFWRAYLTHNRLPLPKRWLLLSFTLAGIIGILIEFHTLFGRDASVTLLILLAALKPLEMRTPRDAILIIHLACFIIITNFFYSQSIPTALLMFVTLLVIVATWLQLQTGALALRPRLRIATTLLTQAIPLMLALFILFPRIAGPLWGMAQEAYTNTGLTDSMTPGSISKLSQSDAVAFRVTFNDVRPLNEALYWRGPVLWEFDGQSWTTGKFPAGKPPQIDQTSNPIDYTVTLEPHNKTWLFALDIPTKVSIPSRLTDDLQLWQRLPVNTRIRYDVQSQLSYRVNVEEVPLQLKRALLLPTGINPRTRALAQQWRDSGSTDVTIMSQALRYFNQQGYSYTLEPPPLPLNNWIDAFLFESKQGFCEHYASAFVFLMRAAGVPARVVTGYQGAQYNALGDYYIVRQSDAHAWAEVWLQGRGWVRADPTAYVAPVRIQQGLASAVPDTAALPLFQRNPPLWMLRLRFNLDMLAFRWDQWVLGYDAERQLALLRRLGMEDVSWRAIAVQMTVVMALLITLLALPMLRHLYVHRVDAPQRLYLRFCRKLERRGITRAPHEGAKDFATRATQQLPQLTAAIHDITQYYLALRYQSRPATGALQQLQQAVRHLQKYW